MNENKKNSFNKSNFSRNIKSLFIKESKNYYNKHRLNLKLKSLISKEKSLNDRKIVDFNYGEMFHFFKVGMKKFEDSQMKRKKFYKTLYEENTRFNKEYQKNYSSNNQINPSQTKTGIKSKTFQKFYDKHQITDTSKQLNNLFNRDPLLVSNNDIKLFYMSKDIKTGEEYKDEALDYVTKLESNINTKSVINKIKNSMINKLRLNKDKDFPFIEDKISPDKKKTGIINLKNDVISRNYYKKYTLDIKKYNHEIKHMISKLNKTAKDKVNKHISFKEQKFEKNQIYYSNKRNNSYNIFNDMDNENFETNYFSSYSNTINNRFFNFNSSSDRNKKKKESKSSNQIASLYNELFKIKKNIIKYEKKNENEIRYLYTIFANNPSKRFKQSFLENQKLRKLDKELVYSVNSFND